MNEPAELRKNLIGRTIVDVERRPRWGNGEYDGDAALILWFDDGSHVEIETDHYEDHSDLDIDYTPGVMPMIRNISLPDCLYRDADGEIQVMSSSIPFPKIAQFMLGADGHQFQKIAWAFPTIDETRLRQIWSFVCARSHLVRAYCQELEAKAGRLRRSIEPSAVAQR